MFSALPDPQGGKVFLCNSEQCSGLRWVLPLAQVIIKKAKRINVEGRKGICTQYTSVLGTAFPLLGAGKERRHQHILPFSGLLFGMPYQDQPKLLGISPNSGSHFLVQQPLVFPSGWVCCHVCSEDMLTIFVSPRIYIIQLFVKAPPILYSTSFLIIATEIQR